MDQQLCILACSALGELGLWGEIASLVVSVLAIGYAGLQRHRKGRSDRAVEALEAEIKVLSLRPPPIAVVHDAAALERLIAGLSPSSPTPSSPTPSSPTPSSPYDDPTNETLE